MRKILKLVPVPVVIVGTILYLVSFLCLLILSPNYFSERRPSDSSGLFVGSASAGSNGGQDNTSTGLNRPVRLKIPKIGVDASVEYLGLTADGEMAVPKGPASVGWFALGTRPGDIGSAVIAGHYGWKNDIPAVFDELFKLEKGDEIIVKDETGKSVIFTVQKSQILDYRADAPEVFSSSDGKAHLNLVTCGGVWDKAAKSYSQRFVIFADKE